MKRASIFGIAIAVFAFVFSSCQPYEEGPSISLLSKKSRLAGEWTVTEILNNGTAQDISSLDPKYTFEKDGTGTASFVFFNLRISFEAEWELTNNGETLRMRAKDENQVWKEWEEFTILKLYKDEMAIERTYFDEDYQTNITQKISMTKE
ncbi:MAG TPA: hypothetical protein PLZ52_00600 [Bacteroidales bacterium]|nr:hypothetical protein [Bacteroidales bacterium]HQL69917.1 hypothetical protein [Bacteroidales bacterium]